MGEEEMVVETGIVGQTVVGSIIVVVLAVILCGVLIRLVSVFFKRLQRKQKKLHLRFLENVIRVVIILVFVLFIFSGVDGISRVYRLVFGSTVVLTGVLGLAAQHVLRDIFAGVMLSVSRPFEIGDRILLSDVEKPCVVEDMTMRHVVLKTMDNIRYIIPNSAINDMTITNTSYHQQMRGTFITVPIAYTADARKAIAVMREVIERCPYTFPNNPGNEDLGGYGEIYLMSYNENALNLETTIWTEPSMDNFLACSEIRLGILEAFREHDIEIPYEYMNVIMKKDETPDAGVYTEAVTRDITVKSDEVLIEDYQSQLPECTDKVRQYCDYHGIDDGTGMKIELLTEELLAFSSSLLKHTKSQFWIEGNRQEIRLSVRSEREFSKKRQLRLISRAGELPLAHQFLANLKISLSANIEPTGWLFESQSLKGDDLEKQLLTAYSDDIRIGIIDKHLVILVTKRLVGSEEA